MGNLGGVGGGLGVNEEFGGEWGGIGGGVGGIWGVNEEFGGGWGGDLRLLGGGDLGLGGGPYLLGQPRAGGAGQQPPGRLR